MTQSYIIVNLDKQEYLSPATFGQEAGLADFGPAGDGIMFVLAILLADKSGDIYVTVDFNTKQLVFKPTQYNVIETPEGKKRYVHKLFGSWAGDRIVIAGNKADNKFIPWVKISQSRGELVTPPDDGDEWNLFHFAISVTGYKDIGEDLRDAIIEAESSWASAGLLAHVNG